MSGDDAGGEDDVPVPTITVDDGRRLAYHRWGADARRPPVLLHHGFSSDAQREWVSTGMVAALLEAGREVIAPDARGHGASDRPRDPAAYGEPRMAADLRILADTLGLERYDLAGYSMGAIVSLLVSADDVRVRRLVVGGVGAAVVELGGVERRVLDPDVLADALLTEHPSSITDPSAAGFRAGVDSSGADRFALAAHARAAHRGHVPLERITAPTLVVAGRRDPLADRPEVLAAAVGAAELLLLDGDHGETVRDPAFVAATVRFLGLDSP